MTFIKIAFKKSNLRVYKMAKRLKEMFFSEEFINKLGKSIKEVYPTFELEKFCARVCGGSWSKMELKQKMRHITICLGASLPADYPKALSILTEVAPKFGGFDAMVFPDFVECFGTDFWDLSFAALEKFTSLCSSEFAVRPFLLENPQRAMGWMKKWARDKNFHVRRLASEGCRTRLPWAKALPMFKKDPTAVIEILQILRDDPTEYVRRSVSNNLNDISKDNPEKVLDICEQWYGRNQNRDWIVKRACRTLLKAGDKRALKLFGFFDPSQITIEGLILDKQTLKIGQELTFSFKVIASTNMAKKIRLEYAVDFVKTKSKVSRKVFQIGETEFSKTSQTIARKHSFKDLSTRKHYPGKHKFTFLINGEPKAESDINLLSKSKI